MKLREYLNEKKIQKVEYEIKRETSKYNKNMKWHLIYYSDLGKRSEWFKTEKEAKKHVKNSIERGKEGKFGTYMEYIKRNK